MQNAKGVELIEIYGRKAPDQPKEFIGHGPMPPIMKIADIRSNYGLTARDLDEDVSEGVNDAMVELVRWMEKQGWTPPPLIDGMPTHLELLKTALQRLEDMLKNDDGQAWKEAERFVEQARKVVPA